MRTPFLSVGLPRSEQEPTTRDAWKLWHPDYHSLPSPEFPMYSLIHKPERGGCTVEWSGRRLSLARIKPGPADSLLRLRLGCPTKTRGISGLERIYMEHLKATVVQEKEKKWCRNNARINGLKMIRWFMKKHEEKKKWDAGINKLKRIIPKTFIEKWIGKHIPLPGWPGNTLQYILIPINSKFDNWDFWGSEAPRRKIISRTLKKSRC